MMMADTTESGDGNGVAVSDAPMEAVESFSFHHIPLTPPSSSSSSPAPREQASNLLHAPPHLSYSATGSRSFNYTQLHSSPFSRSPTTISQPSATEYGFTNTPSITQQSPEANPKSVLSRHSSFQYSAREGWAPPPSPLSRAPVAFPSFSTESPIITSVSSFHNAEDFALQEVVQRQQGSSGMAPPRSRSNKSRWQQVRGRVKFLVAMRRIVTYGNRHTKRLLMLVVLNVAYSTVELLIGLLTGRIGLVSDSFHLTFGCGVLTFSLFAMVVAKRKPDDVYTFGYKRLEVLAAFTNALFLLFLCFSLAVEALHAFVQDESEHKHYLIVSAVTNLAVNLLGVWFFRSYARVRVVYRKAEDMNNHSICLHVISDSIRSAGVILASWLLLLGVKNAETLCLGLVAITVFLLTFPLFKASGGVLLQMVPPGVSGSAFHKCLRQVRMLEDVQECYSARFWELVPGFVVGTLLLQVKPGADEQKVLKHVHSVYNDIGVKDLTVQIEMEHQ